MHARVLEEDEEISVKGALWVNVNGEKEETTYVL